MKTSNSFNMKSKKPWEVEGIEWREVRLGDLIELKYGKGLPKRVRQDGNVPIYGSNGIIGYHNKSLTNAPTIIVGRKGSAGETWISFVPCWVIDTAFYVELKEKRLDWEYIYLYTKLIKRNFVFPKGVKPGINRRDYLKVKIPIPFRNGKPDLETQKKIVEYIEANFSRIDRILEMKKKKLEQLDELWESVLEYAFKPKKGEEWREVKLGDIAEHFMGGTPKTTVDEYWNGGIPWISAKELSNNNIYITKPTRYITKKGLKESNARVAPKNSILLVTTASVGNVAIAGIDLAINQQITAIVPRDGAWFKYLYYYLLHNATRLLLRGQTTFKHINQKMIRKLSVLIPFHNNQPDLEKQKEIANYLDRIYEKVKTLKEKIKNQITQLEEMKESILDEVFNHDKKTDN